MRHSRHLTHTSKYWKHYLGCLPARVHQKRSERSKPWMTYYKPALQSGNRFEEFMYLREKTHHFTCDNHNFASIHNAVTFAQSVSKNNDCAFQCPANHFLSAWGSYSPANKCWSPWYTWCIQVPPVRSDITFDFVWIKQTPVLLLLLSNYIFAKYFTLYYIHFTLYTILQLNK